MVQKGLKLTRTIEIRSKMAENCLKCLNGQKSFKNQFKNNQNWTKINYYSTFPVFKRGSKGLKYAKNYRKLAKLPKPPKKHQK